MALPSDFNTVTLKGTYMDFLGMPVTGTLSFLPNAPHIKHLASDTIIIAKKVDVEVQPDGTFSAVVPITTDPDVVPTFQYAVTENVGGVRRNYNIEIPVELAGEIVDLADLVPVGSVPVGTTALTRLVADAIYALKGSTGGGGEGGESPELRNSGGYIQWKYPSQSTWTNLVALTALTGPAGTAASVSVGTVTTGAAGSAAAVAAGGTSTARVLNFTIPRGDPGTPGTNGRGITSITDLGGSMRITFTDATTVDITIPGGSGGGGEGTVTSVAGVEPDGTGDVPLTKTHLDLDQVDNTSDANKPISDDTQEALNGKVNKTGDETIGGVKTFTSPPVVPDDAFPMSKVDGLTEELNGKVPRQPELTGFAFPTASEFAALLSSGGTVPTVVYFTVAD